ncbi:phenylacetate--CoA ligase family protein [Roseiflexus sp.]|uniref:phenylacetate--CoA ligase family protein n=1 Tax=Roseiflexus sp. TaxID=2562120 RepID=UPI0021DC9340|nr:AMP-binding protein [Roseiflexus sp.]GIV99187.1 MAG: coenzyme F390 synthetase [Roseiflexus sp.]
MDIGAFYAGFDQRVRDIVAYGYDRSPAFRRRMEAAGLTPDDIQTTANLARLPILRKEQLVEIHRQGPGLGGMLTVPLSALRRIFQSPGPIYDPEPDEPDSWRWAPAFRAAGFAPGDIVLNCFGYHLTPAGVMFEEGARAIGCTVIPAGIGNQAQQIDAMAHLGVTAYAGLPSYLKALLERATEQGHDPRSWTLNKAFVAAEPLPPSLRALFEEQYGILVYDGYGTAETGNLGYNGPERQGWHLPDDALVQICDLNTGAPLPPGQTGDVVVTLFRRDYILVRFAVGDLSALMEPGTPTIISTPRLVGWLGRSGDSVKVRGLFVHPRHVEEAIRTLQGVAAYQAVVVREHHRDDMICRIVPTADADATSLRQSAEQALYDALKIHCRVEIVLSLPEGAKPFVDERRWE